MIRFISWLPIALASALACSTVSAQVVQWRQMSTSGLPTLLRASVGASSQGTRLVLHGVNTGLARIETWTFDGTTWTLAAFGVGPNPGYAMRAFVCDRTGDGCWWMGTTALQTGIIQTWRWSGSTWSDVSNASDAFGGAFNAALHPVREVPWMQFGSEFYEWGSPNGPWTLVPTTGLTFGGARQFAFDVGRAVPVVLTLDATTSAYRAHELSGTAWQLRGTSAADGPILVSSTHDEWRRVTVGLATNPTAALEWSGTAWTLRTYTPGPSTIESITYFGARKRLVAYEDSPLGLWELGEFVAQGAVCVSNSDCGTGFCADGRCCDVACGGTNTSDCQACSVAAGALVDGTCRNLPASVTCRASAGVCDVAETCTGSSPSCPSDGFEGASVACRPASGACDVAELCTGSSASCPAADVVADGTVVCRASAGACDQPESCNGVSKTCPSDAKISGTVCRSISGPCDVEELCNGVDAACPGDVFAVAGTVCDAPSGVCDAADLCTGSSAVCPEQLAADDVPCDDQNACTLTSVCRTGVCTETARLDCSDTDPCTTDLCQDGTGACVHLPVSACGADAGVDAGIDVGVDASADASTDTSVNPPVDASTADGSVDVPASAGCSCGVLGDSVPTPSTAWLFALGALVLRRRARYHSRA